MKRLFLVLLLSALVSPAFGLEIEEFPELGDLPETYTVIVKSRRLNVIWRDGRPLIHRNDAAPMFNLSHSGDPYLDLYKVLKAKKYTVEWDGIETMEARAPASTYVPASTSASAEGEQRWVLVSQGSGESPTRVYLDRGTVRGNQRAVMFTYRGDDEGLVDVNADLMKREYQIRIQGGSWSQSKPIPPGSIIEAAIAGALQILKG